MTALTLHPAARRKLLAKLPAEAPHDVLLRPLGGTGPAGVIVSAEEQSFIDAILADLDKPEWRQALAARRGKRRGTDGVLELSQPIHRRHHLVLVEAYCHQPGRPRLDPAKLDGAGFVLRRRDGNAWQGWMTNSPAKLGWQNVVRGDLDPDPARRHFLRPDAAGAVNALILARRAPDRIAEDILPLFPAPPDVCERFGRTVLFGIIPVTSADRSEAAVPAPNYAALPPDEAQAMRDHLSEYLKARPRIAMPRAEQVLDPAWNPLALTPQAGTDNGQMNSFGVFLQQLLVELGAFETSPAGQALLAELNAISLPMHRDAQGRVTATMPAGTFLSRAAPILIGGDANVAPPGGTVLRMPLEWPQIDSTRGARLTSLALACLAHRFTIIAPGTPKFDGDARLYSVRPFIRVRGHDDCPSRPVWGEYSEAFRILPWWDGDGPATKISLPDPKNFRRLKPNVTFELPPSLANLVRGDPKKLADGEGSTGGLDIFWLCSFSIPIITICAFIVLSIFLSLFDLIFRWMAFIKICIPIPKPK
ncbi:MAG: hypothetical protein AB7S57_02010 [Acetobacteraceae bacterium]